MSASVFTPQPKYSPSVENYLEAVLELAETGQPVRSIDVADRLGLSRAAVSKAMSHLAESGLIVHALYGSLELTESGLALASEVLKSHRLLRRFLIQTLGVSEAQADEDACQLEHAMSVETRTKWLAYIEKTCP